MNRTLILKSGVRLTGMQREAIRGIDVCLDVFMLFGLGEMVLTSARGDKHGRYSHHYKGLAWDIRSRDISASILIVEELRNQLGEHYQVILENVDKPSEHIHVEYDPAHITEYPEL